MRKTGKRIAILAAAAALTCAAAAGAAPVIYPRGAQILRYSHAPLSQAGQRDLAWLRSQEYFGAMYRDSGSGRTFAVRGYNTVQGAIAVARGWCRAEATGACRLYATLTPAGFKGRHSSPDGLSRARAVHYRQRFLPHAGGRGHAAYAVSGLDQSGASWGRATARDADIAALDFCRAAVSKAMARARPPVRRAAERSGLGACRIVDRRG